MGQTCHGLCERLKSHSIKNNLRYQMGHKRCSLCALFFVTDEIRCPCCQTKLRVKPRTRKRKLKHME
ncbi:MAG: hypothetical protein QQN41_01725 [Nitrosopumilus sp.]